MLPWQINSIFIIVFVYSFLPGNTLICRGFRDYFEVLAKCGMWHIRAELSKLLLPLSSKVCSKTG